jgi:predicted PurR-regulated permease PerM
MRHGQVDAVVRHPVVLTFLFLAVLGFLWWADEVLKPVAMGLLLALALAPLVRGLERRGIPRLPAALVSVVLAFGGIGVVLFEMGRELTMLLDRMPEYEANITAKIRTFRSGGPNSLTRASEVLDRITEVIEEDNSAPASGDSIQDAADPALAPSLAPRPEPPAPASSSRRSQRREEPVRVEVVEHPGLAERIESVVAPSVELGAQMFIVLTLAIFFITGAEELVGRLIRLVGTERVTVTVQTLNDAGARIARYLALFVGMNALTGVVIGVAMWAVGLEYPLLWGALSAIFRFVPYLGPVLTLALPVAFSLGSGPGLVQPILIAAIILGLELVNNFILEPIIYGKSTNVSPLGLIIAALFWLWLWGPIGLVLSTALTVSLTVAGKYIPALRFLDILFGEEAGIDPELRFYQRLLARDEEGARAVLDDGTREERESVWDRFLIPALARARRDRERGSLDATDLTFIHQVVEETLDELAGPQPTSSDPSRPLVIGVPVDDAEDSLALRMLAHLAQPEALRFEILDAGRSSLQIADELGGLKPDLLVLSHVPPGGLTHTRYLARKLRSMFPGVPILSGYWTNQELEDGVIERTKQAGATSVATSIAEAHRWIDARLRGDEALTPLPNRTLAANGVALAEPT